MRSDGFSLEVVRVLLYGFFRHQRRNGLRPFWLTNGREPAALSSVNHPWNAVSEPVTGRDPATSVTASVTGKRAPGGEQALTFHEPFAKVLGTVESRFQSEMLPKQLTAAIDAAPISGCSARRDADATTDPETAPLPLLLTTQAVIPPMTLAVDPEVDPMAVRAVSEALEIVSHTAESASPDESTPTEIALAVPPVNLASNVAAIDLSEGVSELDAVELGTLDETQAAISTLKSSEVETSSGIRNQAETPTSVKTSAGKQEAGQVLSGIEQGRSASEETMDASVESTDSTESVGDSSAKKSEPETTIERRSAVSRATENYRQIARAGQDLPTANLDEPKGAATSVQVGAVSLAAADESMAGQQFTSSQQDFSQNPGTQTAPAGEWAVLSLEGVTGTREIPEQAAVVQARGGWNRLADLVAKESIQVEASGPQRLQLRLEPSHLGEMVINIQKSANGQFEIRLAVSSSDTQTLLTDRAHDIRQALKERGVDVQQIAVDHSPAETRQEKGSFGTGSHQSSSGSSGSEMPEGSVRLPVHRPKATDTDVHELHEVNFRA